jgi:hypothetical protein
MVGWDVLTGASWLQAEPQSSPLQAWQCWHFGEERGDDDGFTMPTWKALMLANLKGQSQMKGSAIKSNLNMLQFLCNAFDSAAGFTTQSKPKLQRLGELYLTTAVQGVLPPDVTKKGKCIQLLVPDTGPTDISQIQLK